MTWGGNLPDFTANRLVGATIGNSQAHSAAGIVDATYDDAAIPARATVHYNGVEQSGTYPAGYCGTTPRIVENVLAAMDSARGDSLGEVTIVRRALNGQAFSPRGPWETMVADLIADLRALDLVPDWVEVRMGANDQNPLDEAFDVLRAGREFAHTFRYYFPNCTILWIGAEEGTPDTTYPQNAAVIAYQQQLAAEIPNSYYVSTIGLSHADGIHLDADGQHDLADAEVFVLTGA